MIRDPFSNLTGNNLEVTLLTKVDHVQSDADMAKVVGFDATNVASLWQAHGGVAVRVDAPTSRTIKADGIFTSKKGLTLTLRMADCQAFCVYDPVRQVVGLVHCGWRCILADMVPHAVELMVREWGTNPKDILVGAAPALCKKCSEFTDPVRELPGFPADLIEGRCADLHEAANRQFERAGVLRQNIERLDDCTKCNPDVYWTYRGGHKVEVMEGIENALVCTLK